MSYSEEEILQIMKLKEERRELLTELCKTPDRSLQERLDQVKSKLFLFTQNPIYK
jgi:hypothetical protein